MSIKRLKIKIVLSPAMDYSLLRYHFICPFWNYDYNRGLLKQYDSDF